MAISTYKTFLMYKKSTSETYEKLVDIKDYPDLVSSKETIDVTTLSDPIRRQIFGIESSDTKTFNCNYDKADYQKIKALEGTIQHLAVWFGGTDVPGAQATPTGDQGKFSFDGYVSIRLTGGGANDSVGMAVDVVADTSMEFA